MKKVHKSNQEDWLILYMENVVPVNFRYLLFYKRYFSLEEAYEEQSKEESDDVNNLYEKLHSHFNLLNGHFCKGH